jgi:cytoplasmic iron level regulating protein YaaA (DUF328/UPF0246 family)
MLLLLSPAKTLDYDAPTPPEVAALQTSPVYARQAAELIAVLRRCSPREVARLMDLSDALAQLNVARYAAWSPRATARNSKPAVLAFAGDVYEGLDAGTFSVADLQWSQRHVAILSGLYGLLRPLDRLQPYRLEMGTRLHTSKGRDLYTFWGDTPARRLDVLLRGHAERVVVNLASQEYFRAVDRAALRAPVVDCVFEDWSAGRWRIVSFFAKRARGAMARHVISRRIESVAELRSFDADGYAFDAAASSPECLTFRRRIAP